MLVGHPLENGRQSPLTPFVKGLAGDAQLLGSLTGGDQPAKEFLKELLYHCGSESERMYQDIQRLGQEVYRQSLHDSKDLWDWLQIQWGKGPGYKNRISGKTENWLLEEEQQRLNKIIQSRVASMWNDLLEKFEDLVVGVFSE